MTSAFILNDETILCRQTSDGWWPIQIQLPHSQKAVESSPNERQLPYQIGKVALLESLAPIHWLANDDMSRDVNDLVETKTETVNHFTAQAASAITYDYAIAHDIALPIILENSDLESESLTSTNAESNQLQTDAYAFVAYRLLITQLPVALSTQISQAIQLLRWQADTQFCSRCAATVVHANQGERAMVCPVCRLRQYPRVQPCVITAITRPNPKTGETQILLAHHHRYGQQKIPLQYGLIAGFVEAGESLEHAVVREVAEEVGIQLSDIRYVSSQPWPFPSNLMLGFRASHAAGNIVIQEDELSHADFFDLSNLPKIPFKGSIAYELIAQIAHEQGMAL